MSWGAALGVVCENQNQWVNKLDVFRNPQVILILVSLAQILIYRLCRFLLLSHYSYCHVSTEPGCLRGSARAFGEAGCIWSLALQGPHSPGADRVAGFTGAQWGKMKIYYSKPPRDLNFDHIKTNFFFIFYIQKRLIRVILQINNNSELWSRAGCCLRKSKPVGK